jgi:hypothetical protein
MFAPPLLPTPPTDNLYRFLALTGFVLVLSAPVYWASYSLPLAEKEALHDLASRELQEQILKYGSLPAPPRAGEAPTVEFRESAARQAADLDVRRHELRVAENQVALQRRLLRVVGAISLIGGLLGAILASFGFTLWYRRVQISQDKILVLQANPVSAPVLVSSTPSTTTAVAKAPEKSGAA